MAADAPIPLPVLATARLILDAFTPADATALFQMQRDPEVTRYLSMEPMTDVQQAVAMLERMAQRAAIGDELRWALRRRSDGRMIGTISLEGAQSSRRRAELGYSLAREFWRQSYAREAIGAVLACGFGPLHLNRIQALVYAENEPSRALLRSLGFAEEGHLREHAWEKGRMWDDVLYALLAREYFSLDATASGRDETQGKTI